MRGIFVVSSVVAAFACAAACGTYDSDDKQPVADAAPPVVLDEAGHPVDAAACACLPLPEIGWNGPFARTRGETAPDCSGAFGAEAVFGIDVATAPEIKCSQCTCGSPAIACRLNEWQAPTTGCFSNCGVPGAEQGPNEHCIYVPATNAMANTCDFNTAHAFVFELTSAAGAYSCPPSTSAPALATTKPTAVRLCRQTATPPSTCSPAEACLAPAAAGFDTVSCIAANDSGDLACPAGPYTEKTLTYQSFDDSAIACGACACTSTNPDLCNTGLTLFSDTNCAQNPASLGMHLCTPTDATAHSAIYNPSPANATCVPSGGAQSGARTFKGVRTICCTK